MYTNGLGSMGAISAQGQALIDSAAAILRSNAKHVADRQIQQARIFSGPTFYSLPISEQAEVRGEWMRVQNQILQAKSRPTVTRYYDVPEPAAAEILVAARETQTAPERRHREAIENDYEAFIEQSIPVAVTRTSQGAPKITYVPTGARASKGAPAATGVPKPEGKGGLLIPILIGAGLLMMGS